MALGDLLSTDNPVFSAYAYYSGILVLKTLGMSLLTARQRFRKKVFANTEDTKLDPKSKVKFDDPDVERVRRGHQNDLENILPFLVAGFLYVLTNPAVFLAVNLFRAVTFFRILHTIVYTVVVLPQPARAISFFVPFFITAYMSVRVILAFC